MCLILFLHFSVSRHYRWTQNSRGREKRVISKTGLRENALSFYRYSCRNVSNTISDRDVYTCYSLGVDIFVLTKITKALSSLSLYHSISFSLSKFLFFLSHRVLILLTISIWLLLWITYTIFISCTIQFNLINLPFLYLTITRNILYQNISTLKIVQTIEGWRKKKWGNRAGKNMTRE